MSANPTAKQFKYDFSDRVLLALCNRLSGDYYHEQSATFLCIAIVDGKPLVIGRYCSNLPLEGKNYYSKLIWKNFIHRPHTTKE